VATKKIDPKIPSAMVKWAWKYSWAWVNVKVMPSATVRRRPAIAFSREPSSRLW